MAEVGPLEHDQIVVEQVRKLFELRNQYGLFSLEGERIAAVEQVEQSSLQFLARAMSDLDVALPTTLAITDPEQRPVLRLHKPWFRRTVHVQDARGEPLGTIRKQLRLGKARFQLQGADGAELGEVRGHDWRAREFTVHDPAGAEVATVTKQWRGLATELFTDADTYVVDLRDAQQPLRSLALAAALAVDVILKEED